MSYKNTGKTTVRNTKRASRIIRTAEIVGVTPRAVQLILNGERNNDLVLETFMTLCEEEKQLDNKLTEAVKQLVKF